MRSPYLIHGLWVVVAIAAFAAGKMQSSSAPRSASAGESADRSRSSTGPASRSERAERAPGSRAGRSPGAESYAGRVLTPDAMSAAITSVLAETDPIKRQRRFSELLESLTAENAGAAVRALRDSPRSRWNWGQELSLLTFAWGRLDGPAAVAYTRELEGRSKEWTMASVLAGWASEDPSTAKTWIESLEDKGERASFTRGLVYGLAQRDVNQATDYVLKLSDAGDERSAEYMGAIARQQLSQGIESAAQWSESLPDGSLKGSALHTVAGEYVRRNPAEAAAWVAQYAESDFGTRAVAEVSEEWAEDDPTAALAWVTTLPAGTSRNHALGETISEWAKESPTEAGQYLAELPGGDERDFAVSVYARRVVYEEPAAALEWAQSIGNEEMRNSTIARNVREWVQRDMAGAAAWVESANLPEAVLDEIRNSSSNRSSYYRR